MNFPVGRNRFYLSSPLTQAHRESPARSRQWSRCAGGRRLLLTNPAEPPDRQAPKYRAPSMADRSAMETPTRQPAKHSSKTDSAGGTEIGFADSADSHASPVPSAQPDRRLTTLRGTAMTLRQTPVFLSLVVTLLFAGGAAAGQRQPPVPTQDPLVRMNLAVDALTRSVWPSVVQIVVSSYGAREEAGRGETGVVVGRQRSVG